MSRLRNSADESFFKEIPWRRFKEFISPQADRFAILKEILKEAALGYRVLEIAGSRHFVVAPPQSKAPLRRPSMLVAHYDRAPGSPGANDNSAGVFLLIEAAVKLAKSGAENWVVVFTDKEELLPGESIQAQGAYALALGLKDSRMENPKVFCFDACGTGDTLVISTTAGYLLKKDGSGEKLQKAVMELQKLALSAARNLGMIKVLLAPTPFSDDAGFLRAGLAAQTITMLPSAECAGLMSALRKNPGFADAFINAETRKNSRDSLIPETWLRLNGPSDSHLRLTPEHYRAVVRFAQALCRA
ncbi:MAG: M28 family metallopeptidase [Treponema sp.]|nr:M28 family metallopeptidase [Treponema sp.]